MDAPRLENLTARLDFGQRRTPFERSGESARESQALELKMLKLHYWLLAQRVSSENNMMPTTTTIIIII